MSRILVAGACLASSATAQEADDCAGALAISLGETVRGSTLGTSADGEAACGLSDESADVWYRFTAADDCFVTFTTCTGSDFDTVLSVHGGCPGTRSNQIACNDDACGTRSTVGFPAESGRTYRLRVAGFSGARGRFTLTAECVDLPETRGGDLAIADLRDLAQVGSNGDVAALSLTSVICNLGSVPIDWFGIPDERHPVLVFNVFRLLAGRLEQIGQSWAKHGFAVSEDALCAFPCLAEGTGTRLGVGCSDIYDTLINAAPDGFGPRAEIDPWTGAFAFADSHFDGHFGDVHDDGEHLLRVRDRDLAPDSNEGAAYFAELLVVSAGDVNHLNNSGWKPFRVTGRAGEAWRLEIDGGRATTGAIFQAWPGARVVTVPEEPLEDGRCHVALRSWENDDGTWHYEYGVYNLDLARGVASFRVPVAASVAITAPGFHGVAGDEPGFNSDDWKFERTGENVAWRTVAHPVSGERNPLRWGTLYSFRFDADAPPRDAVLALETVRGGAPEAIAVSLAGPASQVRFLRGDCNGDGDTAGNVTDPVVILLFLTNQRLERPPCLEACDADGDGEVNITDAIYHLSYSFLLGSPPPAPFPACGDAAPRIGCVQSGSGC